jgi:hypothetical protein
MVEVAPPAHALAVSRSRCSSSSRARQRGRLAKSLRMPVPEHGAMTLQERVNVLTNTPSNRLEAELTSAATEAEIVALLQVLKAVRAAILAKEATFSRKNPVE